MLTLYEALARKLFPFRWLLGLLAALGAIAFAYFLFQSTQSSDESHLLLSVCLTLWALSLLALTQSFVAPTPTISGTESFLARVKIRLIRLARWLLALLISALFAAVLFLSLRAVRMLPD